MYRGDGFLFIHVPRTGGHSAYQMLGRRAIAGMHTPRSRAGFAQFSFGFMRNPWGRVYSCYRKQRDIFDKYENTSFKQYVIETDDTLGQCQAMWYLKGCDYIGKFEHLQEDWNHIFDVIGIQHKTVPLVNKVGDAEYQSHYDNEMIDCITERHSADIEYGGYCFEPD